MRWSRKGMFFLVVAALAVIAAACSPTTPTAQATPPPAQPTSVPPTLAPRDVPATQAPTMAPAPTTVPFDSTAAEEEGYWYSRYNLGSLVMRSGLGVAFMPAPEMVQAMVRAVDANPDDGDTAQPPPNAALLQAVYASGDPHYTQDVDPKDYGTQRWDPATFDTTVTTRALGWTMIKESEWAKQFHVDNHFGTPADDFGAQQRFAGMVLNAEAKMQAKYALENLRTVDGLFANSDGTIDYTGNWVLLEALSDLAGTLNAPTLPHSASNRYYNPEQGATFLGAADALFAALAERQPADIEEASLAIQALTWYAATTQPENRAAAVARIKQLGTALLQAQPATATERAFVIRGLIEVYRVTGDDAALQRVASTFANLAGDFNPNHGVFNSQHTYTVDDVAVIMGALNSLKHFAGDVVNPSQVETLFTTFFLQVVNLSGLQQAVPPIPVAKGAFEQNEPPIFYGYPTLPKPPMAGGEFGVAPVFATEVTFAQGRWQVTDGRFDTAGAMHASNEFIWFHNDEVNGFPEVPQP